MALIEFKDVSLGYDGMTVAEKLSFSIDDGDYLCIVGENGSGKSTLMKAMLGLVKPLSGSVTTGGGLKQTEIGYLPQQTALQRDFPASVMEVVLSGTLSSCGFRPFFTKKEKALARHNMELLSISDFASHSYHDLSGGQQQRVLLARALCATKKLLLLDEPAAGLDPLITADLYKVIRKLNREGGMAVAMVTHDIPAAVNESKHILHLYHHPLFFGTTQDYKTSDVARAFLGRDGK